MNNDHMQIIVGDLVKAFSQAYQDLKPIATKPGSKERLDDVLHKLRTYCLSLLHEARDA